MENQLTNNDSFCTGVFEEADGTYMALTARVSKSFKTFKGAEKWIAKYGYKADGSRL